MIGTTVRRSDVMRSRGGELQPRHDGGLAWKTAMSLICNLPGLRGAWTMGSFDENGDQFDISEQDRTLSYNGNPTYNYSGLVPYLDLDGTGDWLARTDEAGLDILGTETYVASAAQGLTLGIWFNPDRLTAQEQLIGKGTTLVATSSYYIDFRGDQANDPVRFVVSDGAAFDAVSLDSAVLSTGSWYFAAGRYEPSTEIKVWVGAGTLQSNTNAVGIPAALNNSNSDFRIGAHGLAGALLDGQVGMAFLSTMLLSDALVASIWHHTRALYGH